MSRNRKQTLSEEILLLELTSEEMKELSRQARHYGVSTSEFVRIALYNYLTVNFLTEAKGLIRRSLVHSQVE
jgi:hypothetical protein